MTEREGILLTAFVNATLDGVDPHEVTLRVLDALADPTPAELRWLTDVGVPTAEAMCAEAGG